MSDLISRSELKKAIAEYCKDYQGFDGIVDIIDNAPTVKPCDNCDLYFIAKTKEEMKKGGAE